MNNEDKDKIIFYDFASDRTMCLTFISEQLWLCYKHPDGQFVTDRKATIDDISRLCKLKKNNAEAEPTFGFRESSCNNCPLCNKFKGKTI